MYREELLETVRQICAPGKGILAADESTATIGKRFENIGVENTHLLRHVYGSILVELSHTRKHYSMTIQLVQKWFDI